MTQLSEEEIKRLAALELSKIEKQRQKEAARLAEQQRQRVAVQLRDERGNTKNEIMYAQYFRNRVQRDDKRRLTIDGKEVLTVEQFPAEREPR